MGRRQEEHYKLTERSHKKSLRLIEIQWTVCKTESERAMMIRDVGREKNNEEYAAIPQRKLHPN